MPDMSTTFGPVVPILRMYDLTRTLDFYVGYLGCTVDWQVLDGDAPTYLQVSRGDLVHHLSNHHDDGTPGTAVLVETQGVAELHAELHASDYRHMLPGLERHPRGLEVTVIDPASNRLRFFERTLKTDSASDEERKCCFAWKAQPVARYCAGDVGGKRPVSPVGRDRLGDDQLGRPRSACGVDQRGRGVHVDGRGIRRNDLPGP